MMLISSYTNLPLLYIEKILYTYKDIGVINGLYKVKFGRPERHPSFSEILKGWLNDIHDRHTSPKEVNLTYRVKVALRGSHDVHLTNFTKSI